MRLEDGRGKNGDVGVTAEQHLLVQSLEESMQHHISRVHGNAYQVEGSADVAATTTPVLHIKNTHATKICVITYIRASVTGVSGGTALPADATRWRIGFGRTHSSGGAEVSAVNMNRSSGNNASVQAYDAGPTLDGTAAYFEEEPVEAAGKTAKWSKDGSIILGPSDTMEISLISDHIAGTARARVSFYMVETDHLD